MPKDFKLDPETHDLVIENNDFVLIDGLEQLVQHLKIHLWFVLAEWFLNTSLGVPFYSEVFIKNPDLNAIQALFKNAIMEVEEVTEILNFELEFNSSQRTCKIDFEVDSIYGKSNNIPVEF